MPEGKWLVLSPGGATTTKTGGDGSTAAELLAAAKVANDGIGAISASVDGVSVQHLERFRTAVAHILVLPADNLFGVPAGPTLSADDGYFIVLPPLRVGQHIVTEFARFDAGPFAGFAAGRTFHITITSRWHPLR